MDNKKQVSIKFNFVMNAILTMSIFIFPLITFPYISRILHPEGTGKVSFATSIVSYFAMIAQLGIPTYGIRACAKVRDNKKELSKTVHEIFTINIVMSTITYVLFVIALCVIPKLSTDKVLMIIVSLTIFFNTIGMSWLFGALEKYKYITIQSILFKFIALIAMFVLIHQQSDYVIYGGISIFASSASNVCNFIYAHKFVDFHQKQRYEYRKHLKPIFVFFAMSCATTIYTNLDTVMLGFINGDAEVGFYNAAVKIKSILVCVVTSLGTVLLPRASYYVEHKMMDEFDRITCKAINFVFLAAVPMMVYFMLFAREGISFLSGDAYEPATIPMIIIMPTLLTIGLTNIMGIQVLIPLGKEKKVLYSEVIGAVVDFVINMLLIPRMASAGAAIGTLIAECMVWFVQYYVLRKRVIKAYRNIQYWKIVIAVIFGAIVSFLTKNLVTGYFLTLVVSAIVFFGIYALTLFILKEKFFMEIVNETVLPVLYKLKGCEKNE
ncbi:flippase [Anaerobutyricum soehngenii]|uniref:Flippase n=1 Tax=Anaerobutyricum soehngenii TaxID=105843 RepID=A0A6N7YHQ3_9FIRM|nr:flippase [Anaerobutyricum soehngenii]MSU82548.1 flippase [Anaerobutyricum soehngenii]